MQLFFHRNGEKRYRPGSSWKRHRDSRSPSSDTLSSREPEIAGEGVRRQQEDRCEAQDANFVSRSHDQSKPAEVS